METDTAKVSDCIEVQQSSTAEPTHKPMFHWDSLPLIIRDLIWEELTDKHDCDSPEDRKNRAACAAVSSEWQQFFEGRSFGRLVLHPSALGAFEKIIKRRQRSHPADRVKPKRTQKKTAGEAPPPTASRMPRIKHIWLRIELLPYDCRNYKDPEDGKEVVRRVLFLLSPSVFLYTCMCKLSLTLIHRNNVVFTSAVWKLLDILSTWESSDAGHGQELSLELSAHSLSDSQHMYQDQIGLQDDYPYLADSKVQRDFMMRCHHDATSKKNQLNDEFHELEDGKRHSLYLHRHTRWLMEAMAKRLIRPLDFNFFDVRFRRG